VIRTADDAARYLDGLVDRERSPDSQRGRWRVELGPVRALLAAVGDPQRDLSIIHVAGSKGKGSVCLAAESVLCALGERVGTFTSPHLERWTERFRIEGREVAGERLAEAVEQLRPQVDRLCAGRPEDAPSFFDATTAAALLLFAEAQVDRVLLEVGLGGRLDSTNVVAPRATCITQIEFEHTQILGNTLAEIAGEKAGILKPGVPCVLGALAVEADAVVRAHAEELGVELFAERDDFELQVEPAARDPGASRLRYREHRGFEVDVELPVVGLHLARNAGLALACIRTLREHDDTSFAAAAAQGLRSLLLPGRVEVVSRDPWIVIDSAHTEASARALASALSTLGVRQAEMVLSVSRGKALREILSVLAPVAARMTLTRADTARSLAPEELVAAAREAAPGLELTIEPDPSEAVRSACRAATSAGDGGAVVVAGSVYLAGIARRAVVGEPRSRRPSADIAGPRA